MEATIGTYIVECYLDRLAQKMTTQDLQRNSLICESLSLMKNRALSTHGDGTGKKPLSFAGPNKKHPSSHSKGNGRSIAKVSLFQIL
jgi:hypothetical protein